MRRLAVVIVVILLASCGRTETEPPIRKDPPQPPASGDLPGYTITGKRAWSIAGDALTPGDPTLRLEVDAPAATRVVDLYLDGHHATRARKTSGRFTLSLDITALATGDHHLLLSADAGRAAFAEINFTRSRPLYVAVSNDWDTSDHPDDRLERQDRLHANHPRLVITHFVGPYTFTDATVSPERAKQLVDWLVHYRDTAGDEIGLHIHPYCNFVTAAGVTCRTEPSFAYATDPTGYTVILGSYTEAELDKLFAMASSLFVANGLGNPTSFRAGGWTAQPAVLAAMGHAGHLVDTSACNWARLEEWKGIPDAQLYDWNRDHWRPIDETSQPYYPSKTDILADAAPHSPVLEVPDNGALVDYVTTAEMVEMFAKNFDGHALAAPREYSIGYHPVSFTEEFFARIDGALTEIDKHLAADDAGPVIYARVSDLAKVWRP